MATGLQVFDGQGNVILDTTTRMGVLLGQVNTGKSNGSVTNSAFSRGTPFYVATSTENGATSVIGPNITISGNTLSWQFNNPGFSGNHGFLIIYGVY